MSRLSPTQQRKYLGKLRGAEREERERGEGSAAEKAGVTHVRA